MPLNIEYNLKYYIYILILLTTVALISGCDKKSWCSSTEKLRITSQDSVVDVVIMEKGCGATTSASTEIYILPTQKGVEGFTAVFVADKVRGLRVAWEEPKKLLIEYSSARIFKFTNFWSSKEVEQFRYEVKIKETQLYW